MYKFNNLEEVIFPEEDPKIPNSEEINQFLREKKADTMECSELEQYENEAIALDTAVQQKLELKKREIFLHKRYIKDH